MHPVKKMRSSVGILIRPDMQGNPKLGLDRRVDAGECRRRNANHRVRLRLRPYTLAENTRVAVEESSPRSIAKDCYWFIFVGEPAAQRSRYLHSLAVIAGYSLGRRQVRLVVCLETGFGWQTRSQICECLAAVMVVQIIGVGNEGIAGAAQDGHAVRFIDRERPEEGKVEDGEDRGVDADSE